MSTEQKRDKLKRLYGPSWAGKVEKMSDRQVHSVYMRKLEEGAFK